MASPRQRKPAVAAYRIWLEQDDVRVFGPGTYQLLAHVESTGSLNRAAKEVGMSYTKAWRITHEIERRLGIVLLDRQAGGTAGGGSCLTDDARLLLERFNAFARDADRDLAELFKKYFGDLPYGRAGEAPSEQ